MPPYPQSAPPASPYTQGAPAYQPGFAAGATQAYPTTAVPGPSYPPGQAQIPSPDPVSGYAYGQYGQPGQYGPPGYPGAPVAPKRKTGLIVAIVVVVVLLCIGAGTGIAILVNRNGSTPTAGGGGGGTTATTPPAPTKTAFSGDLRTVLLAAPTSAVPWQEPVSKDGTLTLDQAADLFGDSAQAKSKLTADGFTAGAIAQWHDSDDTLVEIKLYQFEDVAGAQKWLSSDRLGTAGDDSNDDHSPVGTISGSGLYVAKKADSDGFMQSIGIVAKNTIVAVVIVWVPNKSAESATVDLTTKQFARLP